MNRNTASWYIAQVERRPARYTNRDNNHIFVDTLRRIVNTKPLTYERLIAA